MAKTEIRLKIQIDYLDERSSERCDAPSASHDLALLHFLSVHSPPWHTLQPWHLDSLHPHTHPSSLLLLPTNFASIIPHTRGGGFGVRNGVGQGERFGGGGGAH